MHTRLDPYQSALFFLARAAVASRRPFACVIAAVVLTTADAQVGGCSVTTAPLSFGSYDVSAVSPLVTSGKIEVRCVAPTTLTLGIDGASNVAGIGGGRALRHLTASDMLNYNVYQDAALSVAWGNAMTSAGRTLNVSTTQTVFAYGALPAGQDVRYGEYRDTLSIVVMP